MKALLVFVCYGNIHRSVVAERCMKRELEKKGLQNRIEVISRGIQGSAGVPDPKYSNLSEYPLEWKIQKPILDELKIDISQHISTPIDLQIIERASLIIAMDQKVLSEGEGNLRKQFPKFMYKIILFNDLVRENEEIIDCAGINNVTLHQSITRKIVSTIEEQFEKIIQLSKVHTDKKEES